ncbi:hypothetical protein AB1N83_010315 [Pleurotus pulmonarius]
MRPAAHKKESPVVSCFNSTALEISGGGSNLVDVAEILGWSSVRAICNWTSLSSCSIFRGMHRDPDKFDDPETFEPERYLATTYGTKTEDDGAAFRDNMHFGPGCRLCPGVGMGSRNLAINTMNMLGAFRFSKDGDETSQTGGIDLDSAYQKPGMVFSPLPFKCNVVVRDGKRARLIREWHAAETGEH